MKTIDSDALVDLTKALGLTGRGAAITELVDGTVEQTLSVNEIVRRGRTFGLTQGIFTAALQNVHTDSETLVTRVEPYDGPAAGVIAPWVTPIPRGFDIWLLGAVVFRVSGTLAIEGVLALQTFVQGWGIDDSGVAVATTRDQPLAYWDAIETGVGGFAMGILNGTNGTYAKIGLRLPRSELGNTNISFHSTSAATATFLCQVTLGLFPTALGQDGLV